MNPLPAIVSVAVAGRKPLAFMAFGGWGFWAGQFASSFPHPFDQYAAAVALGFAVLGGLGAFIAIAKA